MQLTCLYHLTQQMRVLDDEVEFNKLLASGEWFDHPSLTNKGNYDYGKQRLHTKKRKRRNDCEQAPIDGPIAT